MPISTANRVRLATFVIALVAIVTGLWHFFFIGFCNGSNFCLILGILTMAVGFDVIKYFEEYFLAKPNQPKFKVKTVVEWLIKFAVLIVMLNVSSTFSAKDVVIKHAPTFLVEFGSYFTWFCVYSVAQLKLNQLYVTATEQK